MKVTNCRNCPFRLSSFNDWSVEYDSVDFCSLKHNSKLFNQPPNNTSDVIRFYNESEDCVDEGQPEKEIDSPEWCPLKNIYKLEVEFYHK